MKRSFIIIFIISVVVLRRGDCGAVPGVGGGDAAAARAARAAGAARAARAPRALRHAVRPRTLTLAICPKSKSIFNLLNPKSYPSQRNFNYTTRSRSRVKK